MCTTLPATIRCQLDAAACVHSSQLLPVCKASCFRLHAILAIAAYVCDFLWLLAMHPFATTTKLASLWLPAYATPHCRLRAFLLVATNVGCWRCVCVKEVCGPLGKGVYSPPLSTPDKPERQCTTRVGTSHAGKKDSPSWHAPALATQLSFQNSSAAAQACCLSNVCRCANDKKTVPSLLSRWAEGWGMCPSALLLVCTRVKEAPPPCADHHRVGKPIPPSYGGVYRGGAPSIHPMLVCTRFRYVSRRPDVVVHWHECTLCELWMTFLLNGR